MALRVSILTREYPPFIYGGAGVHVAQLVPQLRKLIDVDVQCMGEPREGATAHPETFPAGANAALRVLGADVAMANAIDPATDVIHSHTWYANFAGPGRTAALDVPHVVTSHSLEPHRPWKAEQLGGGYRVSSWAERTSFADAAAVIAVSAGMRGDVLDCYPELDPTRSTWCTTASTPTSSSPTLEPTSSTPSAWTGIDHWSCSSAGSPGRRA